jgi:AcrR family transcriptional regulator
MPIEDRRQRERAARRALIVTTARRLAEAEGWDAVTTRRLSTEIEYSQPVLYKHFAGMDQLTDAIAIEGFAELAAVSRDARLHADTHADALTRIANAYLDFARDNPAVYDAMFARATTLKFADPESPTELTTAFDELRRAVEPIVDAQDADAFAEVLWASLHGLVTLGRTGRIREGHEAERLHVLVEKLTGATGSTR